MLIRGWRGWALVVMCLISGPATAASRSLGFSLEPGSPGAAGRPPSVEVVREADGSRLPAAEVAQEPEGGAYAVHVSAPGYVGFSLHRVPAGTRLVVLLRELELAGRTELVRGAFGGFPPPASGTLQAGAVFRSLSAYDLLDFRLEAFVSPLRDTIDVMGPREIPSNVVIPDQSVLMPWGPVRVAKPEYRLPVEAGSSIQLSGVQGRMRVSDLASVIQTGRYSFELLNQLQVTQIGLSSELVASGPVREDFDAVLPVSAAHWVTPARPPFSGADVVVVAATDLRGDRTLLLPTDVKTALAASSSEMPRTVTLAAPDHSMGRSRAVVSAALGAGARRVSGVILDPAPRTARTGDFLSVDELPDFSALPERVELRAPARGLSMAVLEAKREADGALVPLWVSMALPGGAEARPARLPLAAPVDRLSVSKLEFGPAFDPARVDGAVAMKSLVRFTRVWGSRR